MRRTAVLIALVLLVVALAPAANAYPQERRRKALIRWTNQVRVERGIAPLRVDWRVMPLAQLHSRRMAMERELFHTVELGRKLRDLGISWRVKGEAIGAGLVGHLRAVFVGFMASPSHRALILDPRFRRIGVGVVTGGGFLWVTVIFYG